MFPCLLHGAGGKTVYLREDRKKKKLTVTTYSFRDFPDGPVLRLQTSSTGGVGLISGQETKIPHALWRGQKKKRKIFLITNSEYGMLMLVIFFFFCDMVSSPDTQLSSNYRHKEAMFCNSWVCECGRESLEFLITHVSG